MPAVVPGREGRGEVVVWGCGVEGKHTQKKFKMIWREESRKMNKEYNKLKKYAKQKYDKLMYKYSKIKYLIKTAGIHENE